MEELNSLFHSKKVAANKHTKKVNIKIEFALKYTKNQYKLRIPIVKNLINSKLNQ